MKYIVTPQQMREIEDRAFQSGVDPLDLMERAAQQLVDVLVDMLGGAKGKHVAFFCGRGNNGGDGLAAARIFASLGGEALIVLREEPSTPSALHNLRRAKDLNIPVVNTLPVGESFDAAVDALIGIGLSSRPLSAEMEAEIETLNGLSCPVLSVDIPSGMNALTGACPGACVRAQRTVTFGWAKPGHYLSPRAEFVGAIDVRDIGLKPHGAGFNLMESLEAADLNAYLPERSVTSHKGKNGRVLMYCGSLGMAGAAAMAALGCLRAGAGLVFIACEEAVIPILQTLAPNAQCLPVERAAARPPQHDVLLAGCGIGQSETARQNLLSLYDPSIPSVLDADALNMLAQKPFPLGKETVITPHVGEAARLLSISAQEVAGDMLTAASLLQTRYGAVVALKSHASVVLDGDRLALNTVGSPALAKGGSGDALAGIITGLLAQGLSGYEAARIGCLWLGKAARMAHTRMGPLSPLTGDILALMGEASLN